MYLSGAVKYLICSTGHLLYETFEIEEKPHVCKVATRKLEEMFHKTDYLRGNFDLVAILMVLYMEYLDFMS